MSNASNYPRQSIEMFEAFANMLMCDDCAHGVGAHDGRCTIASCECRRTRADVIGANIESDRHEHRRRYGNAG